MKLIQPLQYNIVYYNKNIPIVVIYCNRDYSKYFLRLSEYYAYNILKTNYDLSLLNYEQAMMWYSLYNVSNYDELYCGRFFTYDYIKNFFTLYYYTLHNEEKELLHLFLKHELLKKFKNTFFAPKHFYVIVINNTIKINVKKVLQHEYSHFLFINNKKYRKVAKMAISQIPKSALIKIKEYFKYNNWVYNDDELAAIYIGERSNKLLPNKKLRELFTAIHNEFIKNATKKLIINN